jgi:lipoate-protein ligase A
LLFNSDLEYVIKTIQENYYKCKSSGTHKTLVCADDLHLLDEKINITHRKNREALIETSKKVGLEVNSEKIA